MTYILPQSDPNSDRRKQQLKEAQKHYKFNLEKFAEISQKLQYPMVDKVLEADSSKTQTGLGLGCCSNIAANSSQSIYV
jgi:hypothetical protein